MLSRALAAALLVASLASCAANEDDVARASDCESDHQVGGACAGLRARNCQGDACASGVSCTTKIAVASGTDLAGAAEGAPNGSCLTLAAGTYGDVQLPGGVSLLGVGATSVRVGHVVVKAGDGATLQGFTANDGIELQAATGVRMESVRIDGSSREGLRATDRSSVTVRASEIVGSAAQGVLALDDASVTLQETVVEKSRGAGVWLECSGGCACDGENRARLERVIVRGNGVIGVALVGVHASLDAVDVREQQIGSNLRPAGGIVASKCATLEATNLRVLDNTSFGVLVDGAQATLGGDDAAHGIEIARNVLGVWVQNTDPLGRQPFVLANANVHENQGVGVGVSAFTGSVLVRASEIASTQAAVIPTVSMGAPAAKEVGDGITWGSEALVRIEDVRLRANHRASVLIDGSVAKGSAILRTSLLDGDDLKGVVQQRFPTGGITPDKDDLLPAPQRQADEVFAFPTAPNLPAR